MMVENGLLKTTGLGVNMKMLKNIVQGGSEMKRVIGIGMLLFTFGLVFAAQVSLYGFLAAATGWAIAIIFSAMVVLGALWAVG